MLSFIVALTLFFYCVCVVFGRVAHNFTVFGIVAIALLFYRTYNFWDSSNRFILLPNINGSNNRFIISPLYDFWDSSNRFILLPYI